MLLLAVAIVSPPTIANAAVTPIAHGSAEQVWVTGVAPGATATLLDAGDATVATETVDAQGGVLFRLVTPGTGYRVQVDGMTSEPVTVHSSAPQQWNPSIYNQTIPDSGYGYLTTRDGTQLAYAVHLPTAGGCECELRRRLAGWDDVGRAVPACQLQPAGHVVGMPVRLDD